MASGYYTHFGTTPPLPKPAYKPAVGAGPTVAQRQYSSSPAVDNTKLNGMLSATPPPVGPPVPPPDLTYFNDLAAGEEVGNKLFADGSMGRITNPREKEINDLIATQKSNLGGITPQEQEAARTNALLGINNQANQQLRSNTNAAAGHGLRGGVVQGANAQVLGQAQGAYSGALRDLMGKVQQSQVDAGNALGGTLGYARDVDNAVQGTNLAAGRSELMGRLSTPFDYASLADTYRSGDTAQTASDAAREQALNTITERIGAARRQQAEARKAAEAASPRNLPEGTGK